MFIHGFLKPAYRFNIEADGFETWGEKQPYIQGGGLKYRYRLVRVHFHWAQYDHFGSEHKIGGLHYPAELHLVHVRHDLTLSEAVRKIDGIAVVGVFLMIEDNGSSTAAFSSVIENIIFPGKRSSVRGFRTQPLLPKHTEAFYRYEGSLTTPECYEAVIWTLLAEPITINGTQAHNATLPPLHELALVMRGDIGDMAAKEQH
ncbi:hypothetical protein Y032_0059g3069 [Ancylostoma ceylanicum]|uniref:Carbonic anhydrase n=1 Tax=Ancylostoma ceylanicum TaxID=53326 RepID=A0A016U4Q3_9BILA|nr:hypothetical protein Y032_0059g3069 [Ancylostoma ceylanicum]